MEITGIDTHLVQDDDSTFLPALQRYLFVEVHTDAGISGLGEASCWAHPHATRTAIESLAPTLRGRDPRRRDHVLQTLTRTHHFSGAVLMGAVSAIDLALWDISGKHLDVPVAALLGGRNREHVRAAYHARGSSRDELVSACQRASEAGFTAIGPISPFTPASRDEPFDAAAVSRRDDAIAGVAAYRDAVGRDVDLVVELHRRLDPGEAVVIANGLAEFDPYYVEDPIRPESIDAMARVVDDVTVPIGTGERLHTLSAYEMLLARATPAVVRLDVGLAGGLTTAKKIAALAESRYVDVAPHLAGSPVALAGSLHLAGSIPNVALQGVDYDLEAGRLKGASLFEQGPTLENGVLVVPDRSGLGVELDHGALEALAEPEPAPLTPRHHADGSIVDQ